MIDSMYNISSINGNNEFSESRFKTAANGTSNPITTKYTIPYGDYDVYFFNRGREMDYCDS